MSATMAPAYSIGVVTYHARFEEYFKPLITDLARIFPDKEILCVLNGNPDATAQIRFLDAATSFMKQFPNVRYVAHATQQPLARSWNQLVALSHTEKVIIMHDNTGVSEVFREEFERYVASADFFTINRTWHHFMISKNTTRSVGWFEERFPGNAWEDVDYMFRMIMNGYPNITHKLHGILYYAADLPKSGWQNPPHAQKTKYTYENEVFFHHKWYMTTAGDSRDLCPYPSPRNESEYFGLKAGMKTPVFYDLSVLDNSIEILNKNSYVRNTLRYHLSHAFFGMFDAAVGFLRQCKYAYNRCKGVSKTFRIFG